MLCQADDNGREYVVRYGSHKTDSNQRNYGATELECAAVVHFVQHWRPFLHGCKFTTHHGSQCVKVDHDVQGLEHTSGSVVPGASNFDFEVVYRKGKLLAEVDALSRAIPESPPTQTTALADYADSAPCDQSPSGSPLANLLSLSC